VSHFTDTNRQNKHPIVKTQDKVAVRQELARLTAIARYQGGRSLGMVFDQIRPNEAGDLQTARRALEKPPYRLDYSEIHAIKKALRGQQMNLECIAGSIRHKEESLRAWIEEADHGLIEDELLEKAVKLLGYVAWLFIPSVGLLGQHSLGYEVVDSLVSRFGNSAHRNVRGAGNGRDEIGTRHLLLGPCLGSLTLHFPSE
jgi:hypothetical protein